MRNIKADAHRSANDKLSVPTWANYHYDEYQESKEKKLEQTLRYQQILLKLMFGLFIGMSYMAIKLAIILCGIA